MNTNGAQIIFQGSRILIVDDEPDLREVLSDRFAMEGAEVLVAENGRIALELLRKEHFDVMISDIRMPGGNGLELLKSVRSLPDFPAVILISGFSDVDPKQVLALGAFELLVKPFDLDDLVHAIFRALSDNRIKTEELKC